MRIRGYAVTVLLRQRLWRIPRSIMQSGIQPENYTKCISRAGYNTAPDQVSNGTWQESSKSFRLFFSRIYYTPINMSKIYTKTGDKGTTSLFDGTRVDKDDIRVDTYGTIDELNSQVGVVVAHLLDTVYEEPLKGDLLKIQDDLFTIGALLADPNGKITGEFSNHLQERVKQFEVRIDQMTEEMPELKNFILPGGGKAGAFLQMTRTIARRAERRLISLFKKEEPKTDIVVYFNRLSDVFFTMSRYINFKEGNKEVIWNNQ